MYAKIILGFATLALLAHISMAGWTQSKRNPEKCRKVKDNVESTADGREDPPVSLRGKTIHS
eukprot:snap_masked-scaffold270_size230592-processed-gene-1.16 protein:Tk10979 transcript:snap_masked-scaffold270_size230592-processed-gene-1.16-mRNA-1 annotation:"30s ribosomal protein s1"